MIDPTPEQKAAVETCTHLGAGELALANAYAGGGKTTTLTMIGTALAPATALYVCYNADMAREAEKKLPPNVTSKTSHGLAYGPMMRRHPEWKSRLGNLRARDVQMALRISDPQEAQAVCETFAHFLCLPVESAHAHSPIDAITPRLVSDAGWGFLDTPEIQAVVRGCRTVYRSIFEGMQPALAVPHDAYLWAYILSNPVVPQDTILLDEGQDLNRLMLRFVQIQRAAGKRVSMVGDRHQGIYAWRGAVNALEIMADEANYSISLTESFRFPQRIATAASRLLNDFKHDPVRIKGSGRGHPPFKPSQCFIARTNARIVQHAATLLRSGTKLHFAATREADGYKPTIPYKFEEIRDVYRLWAHQSADSLRTPWLRQFPSFLSLLEYASPAGNPEGGESEKGGDPEVMSMVKLVETYRYDTLDLLRTIETSCSGPREARWSLSTAHRSKGKEWDNITLSDDFLPLDNPEKLKEARAKMTKQQFTEAVNLLYVGVTRGKVRVNYPANCQNYFAGQPAVQDQPAAGAV